MLLSKQGIRDAVAKISVCEFTFFLSYLFVLTKFKKNSTNHLNNEDVSNVQDQETKELLKNEDEGPLLGQIQTRRSDHSKKTLRECEWLWC